MSIFTSTAVMHGFTSSMYLTHHKYLILHAVSQNKISHSASYQPHTCSASAKSSPLPLSPSPVVKALVSSSPPLAARDDKGVVPMPYFAIASGRLTWWSSSTRVSRLTCCKRMFKVFQGFIYMLQVFHADVAYVAMAIRMLQAYVSNVFIYFFRRMLRMGLFGCCICFKHMLQLFYLNVTYALQ
jgi:hypothetical protein